MKYINRTNKIKNAKILERNPVIPWFSNFLNMWCVAQNEARTEKDKETLTPASPPKNEIVDQRELDELLRFINGAKDDAALPVEVVMSQPPADNKATAKAAKRARQKQRKVTTCSCSCVRSYSYDYV